MKIPFPLSLLLLFLCCHSLLAQDSSPAEAYDELVRWENTDLSSGTEYIEQHIIRNNRHKYFLTQEFQQGEVVYEGQTFQKVPMKYNVFDDLLLVRIAHSGGESVFELHRPLINEFSLDNHRFLRISPEEPGAAPEGFYQLLWESPQGQLLKKHRKKLRKHLDKNFTYYEFEPESPHFLFFDHSSYHPVSSRGEVQKLFPEQTKIIRQHYTANRQLRKTDPDRFLVNLFNTLTSVVPKP